jgi:hypothetical protein
MTADQIKTVTNLLKAMDRNMSYGSRDLRIGELSEVLSHWIRAGKSLQSLTHTSEWDVLSDRLHAHAHSELLASNDLDVLFTTLIQASRAIVFGGSNIAAESRYETPKELAGQLSVPTVTLDPETTQERLDLEPVQRHNRNQVFDRGTETSNQPKGLPAPLVVGAIVMFQILVLFFSFYR